MPNTDTEVKKLRFTITGEFMTQHCRSLFQVENNQRHAIHTLVDGLPGMTEAQAIDVCVGKAKLTGDSNVGINIEPDDFKEIHGQPMKSLMEIFAYKEKKEQELKEDISDLTNPNVSIASPWGMIEIPFRMSQMYYINPMVGCATNGYPKRGLKEGIDWDHPYFKQFEGTKPKNAWDFWGKTNHNVANEIEPEKPKPVEADTTLNSLNGYITPDGKFYPCAYSGHINMLDTLDKDSREVDKLGWVKVQVSPGENIYGSHDFLPGEKKITQKQMDVIFDWCSKHKREYPKDLMEIWGG